MPSPGSRVRSGSVSLAAMRWRLTRRTARFGVDGYPHAACGWPGRSAEDPAIQSARPRVDHPAGHGKRGILERISPHNPGSNSQLAAQTEIAEFDHVPGMA